jgi:hypothetical protein
MKPQLRETSVGLISGSLVVMAGLLLIWCGRLGAQPRQAPPTTADVQIVSAEVQRFAKPVRLDSRSPEYDQALVLTLRADERQVDAFPPSLQPVVLIGRDEYRIFREDRVERQQIVLTVHVPQWNRLEEGAPVILTVAQGPDRNVDRLVRPGTPRFSRKLIVDKR